MVVIFKPQQIRVATSYSQKNGTVQGPKACRLRPEGLKNEAEGQGRSGVLGEGVEIEFW